MSPCFICQSITQFASTDCITLLFCLEAYPCQLCCTFVGVGRNLLSKLLRFSDVILYTEWHESISFRAWRICLESRKQSPAARIWDIMSSICFSVLGDKAASSRNSLSLAETKMQTGEFACSSVCLASRTIIAVPTTNKVWRVRACTHLSRQLWQLWQQRSSAYFVRNLDCDVCLWLLKLENNHYSSLTSRLTMLHCLILPFLSRFKDKLSGKISYAYIFRPWEICHFTIK